MKYKQVAIITRTKNRAILLRRAIESVLSQTSEDWIHVIVNDGGNPEPVDALVEEFSPRYLDRVQIIHNPESLGMEAASNAGIRASTSDYVVIHDDDDSWQPTFLERCVTFLEQPPAVLNTPIGGVVTYSVRVLEEIENNEVRILSTEPFNDWMTGISLYRLAASNMFPPISFVFSRAVMEEVGLFREDLPVLGDWDFHLRVCTNYEIGLVPEPLANYHHRVSLQSGEYGNSVIAGDDKHRRYDHLLRNEWLRNDIKSGKAGIGFLVNTAQNFEIVHHHLSFAHSVWNRLTSMPILKWFKRRLVNK